MQKNFKSLLKFICKKVTLIYIGQNRSLLILVMKCEPPFVPRHGILIREREEFRVNQFATFECEVGYQLIGNAVLKCVPDLESGPLGTGGKWDSDSPTCQGKLILRSNERKLKELMAVNFRFQDFPEGVPTPQEGALTYYFTKFLIKKECGLRGVPSAPLDAVLN